MSIIQYQDLITASTQKLETIMRHGTAPAWQEIVDYEFRGYNILPPHAHLIMKMLGNLRFIKCFYETNSQDHQQVGCNLKVGGSDVNSPWQTLPDEESPTALGFYDVYAPNKGERFGRYPHALLIDYNNAHNTLLTGKTLKDYLVQVEPDNSDLLLGKAYFHLGPIASPSFFALERLQKNRKEQYH